MVGYILLALGALFVCGLVWLAWEVRNAPLEEELWPDLTKDADDPEDRLP
jgi:hypothetical protein